MSWATAGSAIFRPYLTSLISGAEAFPMGAGQSGYKVALYNNSADPNKDVAAASGCYAVDTWVTGNECSEPTNWPAGGRPAARAGAWVTNPGAGVIMLDIEDTASATSSTTLANVYGSLLYYDSASTPDDQGVCFNYFGGTNSVTSGTLTIVWHANGLFRITV